jgi:hypothetical protein
VLARESADEENDVDVSEGLDGIDGGNDAYKIEK